MKSNPPRTRQVYNKQQLNKKNLLNRQTNVQKNRKRPITIEIKKELESEDDNKSNTIPNENVEEKAGDSENNPEKSDDEKKEEKQEKKSRYTFNEKVLLYNENGIRKYYEAMTNANINSKDMFKNLDKLITLTRNWHYMLFPKIDFNYFTAKLTDLGKKKAVKSYMSRLRKIYKGEENWDVMYNEQNQILGKTSIMNEQNEFQNPNPTNENKVNKVENKEVNKEANKENKEIEFDKDEQDIIKELALDDDEIILDDDDNNNNINKKMEESFDEIPDDVVFPEPEENKNENKMVDDLNELEKLGNEKPILSKKESIEKPRSSSEVFGNEDKNENDVNIPKVKQ